MCSGFSPGPGKSKSGCSHLIVQRRKLRLGEGTGQPEMAQLVRGWIPTQQHHARSPAPSTRQSPRSAPPQSQQEGSHAPLHQDKHKPCPSFAST